MNTLQNTRTNTQALTSTCNTTELNRKQKFGLWGKLPKHIQQKITDDILLNEKITFIHFRHIVCVHRCADIVDRIHKEVRKIYQQEKNKEAAQYHADQLITQNMYPEAKLIKLATNITIVAKPWRKESIVFAELIALRAQLENEPNAHIARPSKQSAMSTNNSQIQVNIDLIKMDSTSQCYLPFANNYRVETSEYVQCCLPFINAL